MHMLFKNCIGYLFESEVYWGGERFRWTTKKRLGTELEDRK